MHGTYQGGWSKIRLRRPSLRSYLVKSYLLYLSFLILHIIPHIPARFCDQMSSYDLIGVAGISLQIEGHTLFPIYLQLTAQTGRVYIFLFF